MKTVPIGKSSPAVQTSKKAWFRWPSREKETKIPHPVVHTANFFLTHAWGKDGACHKRVCKLADKLEAKGYTTWLDRDKMAGPVLDKITKGIEDSEVVVVNQHENRADFCKVE